MSLAILSFMSYLGDLEKVLGDVNDSAEILDAVNALLDSRSVVFPGRVQDALDLIGLALGPLLVSWSTVDGNTGVDSEEAEQDNGLLVDDVELV